MPSTMKIEFTGEFKADIEKRDQATAVHLMGEAFDALKAKMVELGLLNVSGDIRTVPERASSARTAKKAEVSHPIYESPTSVMGAASTGSDVMIMNDPEPELGAIVVGEIGDLPNPSTKRHRAA